MEASDNLFPGVRIVLVETSHPGNIGAAARAMKNMGLTELVLVKPQDFPSDQALHRAVSAEDLLSGARVVMTLDDAIEGTELVIGTSARDRRIPWPLLSPNECGLMVNQHVLKNAGVALVFGPESRGLSNEDLHRCQFHVNIPTGKAYTSLNLAMAVQVLCYEILKAKLDSASATQSPASHAEQKWDLPYADATMMAHFYTHLEQTLINIKFHDPEAPKQLMTRLRRLFNRIRPDQMEISILRGILNAVDRLGDHPGEHDSREDDSDPSPSDKH